MIPFWNRKELLVTYDMEKQAKVRDRLNAEGIDYKVKVVTPDASMRARVTSYTIKQYEYKIYVNKKDYEAAQYLLSDLC